MSKIKVLIVDDHDMVRYGLSVLLESFEEITLAGEARDGKAALDWCRRQKPDVVLMDIVMPGMDGSSTTRRIRQAYPDVKVIVLTSFEEEANLREIIQAGASGYLLKNVSGHELVEAICKAHSS